MPALLLHSRRAVLPAGTEEAWVMINQGIITAVHRLAPAGSDVEVMELGDQVLIPGIIDPHVHVNEPGRTEWEGFDTATRAAIAGGITTLVDMPLNASPVTTSVDALNKKIVATRNQLHTNVGFWGGIVPGNHKEVAGLISNGVLGFKAFLTHSGIDEFPNVTAADLRKVMPIIAQHRLPLLVHCELADDHPRGGGDLRSYQNYLATRPAEWETNAIQLMIGLSKEYNCKVHIVHLSAAEGIQLVQEAKSRGVPITAETGQHYLYFAAETIGNGQTQFKCAPPIRSRDNNDQLWRALQSGIINLVATDHSPCLPALKKLAEGDFIGAWGGIASLQFALPALLTAAKKRNCTWNQVITWLCEQPAQLIGKGATLGKIAPGYEANLAVVDDRNSFVVTHDRILHRHPLTPYLGEELVGLVTQTYLGGQLVYKDGRMIAANSGKLIFSGMPR